MKKVALLCGMLFVGTVSTLQINYDTKKVTTDAGVEHYLGEGLFELDEAEKQALRQSLQSVYDDLKEQISQFNAAEVAADYSVRVALGILCRKQTLLDDALAYLAPAGSYVIEGDDNQ